MLKTLKKSQYVNLPPKLNYIPNFHITEEADYELLSLNNINFIGQHSKLLKFEDCYFKSASFGENKIYDIRFKNTRMEETDLANTRLDKALIEDVEFIKCRMTGFKVIEGNFRNVLFKDCQLKLSQFRMSKFKNIEFTNCILEEADFYGTTLSDVKFKNCVLGKAEFSATNLTKTDFRTSKIQGLNISIDSLKGAIIDPTQINDLAWLLGAKIEWS